MGSPRHNDPPDDELAVDTANEMLDRSRNRTVSPAPDAMEASPGLVPEVEALDGQLGPDEISEPEEVVKNYEAKLHH
jgi:hypothetical protein